jgi:glycosyltransferase involved in cell wall biosynthesis
LKHSTTVTAVIPSYNYGRFISDAIVSALSQSYPVSEIIVVDDGSNDNTESIVRSFGNNVELISQPNLGVSAARNRGVACAKGELIAFLDADDIWLPEKIRKQVEVFDSNDQVGLVHCGYSQFDDLTGEVIRIQLSGKAGWVAKEHVLFEQPIINVSGSLLMVRRTAFDAVGGFDTRLTNGEDWEFCFRVARKYMIGFVPEPLVRYRDHGRNAYRNISEMERSTLLAWSKVFATDDPEIARVKRRSYGNLYKVLAGSYLKQRLFLGFLRTVLKSIWFRPDLISYYASLMTGRRND